MKTLLHTSILATLILGSTTLTAQSYVKGQTYTFTKDATISGKAFPDQCESCVINIDKGVTVTISKDISIPGAVINGGNIILNNKLTFWSTGTFDNVTMTVNGTGSLVSSAALTIKNSDFTFTGKSTATFWATVDMTKSKMKFLGNSSMEVTSAFNLGTNSAIVVGDGTKESAAFVKFNGGTLNEQGNAYVTVMNVNNYYFNWSNYNGNNKSYTTTNNKMNCGASGKNDCSAPTVYGPSTLSASGVASSATLPVKLSAFAVKMTGSAVAIAWTSDMEVNFDRYEIERSLDGITWSTVGTVKSNGNGSTVSVYSFTDNLKVNGTVSYRLKMIDIDATVAYSPIKSVKSDVSVEMNIFPNPTTDYVTVNAKNNTEKLNIQLINQNGQILKQVNGTGRQSVAVREFSAGNYIVRVTDSTGLSQSFKLAIRK
ncbi:MAG: T9SS type A sorting domain-containing protein [Flavitalea sp.]